VEALLAIIAGCIGVLYWYTSLQSKTYAVRFARRECERHHVQLLDQTVQQVKLSMSRDGKDHWRFWREYRFEYSIDGIDRFEGRLTLLGHRLIRSALENFDPIIH
jgi:hypothetical protein